MYASIFRDVHELKSVQAMFPRRWTSLQKVNVKVLNFKILLYTHPPLSILNSFSDVLFFFYLICAFIGVILSQRIPFQGFLADSEY